MASPAVTYTFTNSTVADADEVNTNFSDLINSLTDGTKDLSISAITAAGAATFNGNVTLGNASSDDVTVTGALASNITIKNTNTYNIGSSTLGLASVYFGTADSDTARIVSAALAASRTYTMPDAGTDASFVMTAGSQTLAGALTLSSTLDVEGLVTVNTAVEAFNGSSTASAQTMRLSNEANDNAATHMRFRYNNGAGGYTNQGGIVGNGSTGPAFFNGSDRRIKTNIQDMPSILDKICSVELKKWEIRDSNVVGFGPIAQDLYKIFPSKVMKTDDGEGDDLPEDVEPWSVSSGWEFEFMKCIQELKAENDELRKRLNDMVG